jgi:hypothetical protein
VPTHTAQRAVRAETDDPTFYSTFSLTDTVKSPTVPRPLLQVLKKEPELSDEIGLHPCDIVVTSPPKTNQIEQGYSLSDFNRRVVSCADPAARSWRRFTRSSSVARRLV